MRLPANQTTAKMSLLVGFNSTLAGPFGGVRLAGYMPIMLRLKMPDGHLCHCLHTSCFRLRIWMAAYELSRHGGGLSSTTSTSRRRSGAVHPRWTDARPHVLRKTLKKGIARSRGRLLSIGGKFPCSSLRALNSGLKTRTMQVGRWASESRLLLSRSRIFRATTS